jgi:hypothetical protein
MHAFLTKYICETYAYLLSMQVIHVLVYIYKHIYQGKSEMLHYTAEGGDGKKVGALLEAKGGSWDLLGELG